MQQEDTSSFVASSCCILSNFPLSNFLGAQIFTMPSYVRQIRRGVGLTSFAFGTVLNSALVFLILKHTPKTMQVYSKILLQTCFNDLSLLLISVSFDGYMFIADGGMEVWNDGWLNQLSVNSPVLHWIDWFLFVLWCFLVYLSLFGVVAQFIYRYLTLNHYKMISLRQYFAMLGGITLIPLVYCVMMGYSYYLPPPEHQFLRDQAVADFLDVNITGGQTIMISAYNNLEGNMMTYAFWYILSAVTLAYGIMIVLGWRMFVFVRANLKGATNKQAETLQRQKQITLTLIIQAILPSFIYISCLFLFVTLVFNVNWLGDSQYYNFLAAIPMYLPSALNPAVTILVIRDYRIVFRRILHCIFYCGQGGSTINKTPMVQPLFIINNNNNNYGLRREAVGVVVVVNNNTQNRFGATINNNNNSDDHQAINVQQQTTVHVVTRTMASSSTLVLSPRQSQSCYNEGK